MSHFLFLAILLKSEQKLVKSIFSSYFQPFKYVIISCMIGAVGFRCILNIPDWKLQLWHYLNSCMQTLFWPDPIFLCSLNSPPPGQPSGRKPCPASPVQWPHAGNSGMKWMNVTFVSGDKGTGIRPPTHSIINHVLVMCWLTLDFSCFSRGNELDNKNLMFFRSSSAKSSLILAINTLKVNNNHTWVKLREQLCAVKENTTVSNRSYRNLGTKCLMDKVFSTSSLLVLHTFLRMSKRFSRTISSPSNSWPVSWCSTRHNISFSASELASVSKLSHR